MGIEFIKGEAVRQAQERLAKQERSDQERRLREEAEVGREGETRLKAIEEHNLRFQPLQGILDFFAETIEGIRQEYFPDSAVFLIDNYGRKKADLDKYAVGDFPYDYCYRSLTFVGADGKFFTVYAVAEVDKEGKDQYGVSVQYGNPDLSDGKQHSYDYATEEVQQRIKKTIEGKEPGERVNLTPTDSLFVISKGDRDSDQILTFQSRFPFKRGHALPLPLDFRFMEEYHPYRGLVIPFEVSKETTDAVLRRMSTLLSDKEYEKLNRPL